MRNFILFSIFSILIVSCSDGLSQESKVDTLTMIATSTVYKAYGKAVTKNLNDGRKGLYDLDEIIHYLDRNHENEPDLCKVDFDHEPIPGIQIYVNNICDLNQAMNAVKLSFPSYNQLSKEKRTQIHEIYTAKFLDPSEIYFNKKH